MNREELDPELEKGECWVTQLEEPKTVILPKPLQKLIDIDQDLFHEPNNLPSPRAHDHSIPIKEGVVLSQEGKPITLLSKALGPKNTDISTYE